MVMNTVIVDDEPFAVTLLQEDLAKIPFVKVVATFSNPILAISYLQQNQVNLVFTDISMPDITGLQLIKSVSGNNPLFILATAHREFAVEAFELDAVDYLVKPYGFERVFKAVLKAQQLLQPVSAVANTQPVLPVAEQTHSDPGHSHYIFVKSDYKDVKLNFSEVIYIQALKDYIKIYKEGTEKPLLTQMNLKAIEDVLPTDSFCRVHRSYIVNASKVNAHNKTELFIGNTEIPIGDFYRNGFLKVFKG